MSPSTEPSNIIDLMPYLEAVRLNEAREQAVASIMASSISKSNLSEHVCAHGVPFDVVCGLCEHERRKL